MLICLDSLCHNFCNKRNFKYSSSINYWLVDIILSRSRPVGNVREIAKVELGVFTARSRNLEFISWQSKNRRKFSPFLLKCWRKNPPVLKSRSKRKILFLPVENRTNPLRSCCGSREKTLWYWSQEVRERSSFFQSNNWRENPLRHCWRTRENTPWCCSWRLRERSSQFQCWSKRKILLYRSRKQEENILFVPVVVLEKKPSGIVVWSQEERERSSSFKSSQRKYPLLKSNCEEFFRSKSKRTRKRLPTTEVSISSFCSF